MVLDATSSDDSENENSVLKVPPEVPQITDALRDDIDKELQVSDPWPMASG